MFQFFFLFRVYDRHVIPVTLQMNTEKKHLHENRKILSPMKPNLLAIIVHEHQPLAAIESEHCAIEYEAQYLR